MTADCLETNGQALAARAVFHHSLITKSTTALKFQGAAALQLSLGRQDEKQILTDYRLVASPFNEPPNLLDLRRLNHSDQILAKALTLLRPVREDYAIAPYTEVFNWEDVLNALRMIAKVEGCTWEQEQTFYIVEFRSKQNPAIDGRYMDLLDYHSHEEAIASGGLLKYWFGEIDEQRRNLATCIWSSKQDAEIGGLGPWHQRAKGAIGYLYEYIDVSAKKWVIGPNMEHSSIEPWYK